MKTSTYPVLDNRPIDQWKVAELKEELKRRKLTTKGLKEDLVKRLDEAIRNETEAAAQELDCSDDDPQSKTVTEANEPVQIVDGTSDPVAQSRTTTFETADDTTDCGDVRCGKLNSNLDQVGFDGDVAPQGEDKVQEKERIGDPKGDEVPMNDMPVGLDSSVCEHSPSEIVLAVQRSQISEMEGENRDSRDEQDFDDLALCMQGPLHDEMEGNRDSKAKTDSDEVKPSHVDVKLNLSDPSNQVSEVSPSLGFPVKSDSITTDSVSINETNDLKDNIIADNVKLEIDVKPEMMVQSSSSDLVPDAGKSHPMDAEEPHENQVSVEDINSNVTDADISKKNYTADLGSSEKLNLDRSSGDDSMEEDALESKQIESTYNSDEVGDRREKNEMPRMKEENPVDVMVDDLIEDKKDVHVENENGVAALAEKRKLSDQEANPNDEPSKRQRRWKSERLKVMEPKSLNISPSTTPKDDVLKPTLKRNFSLSKSGAGNDGPEERVVPPPTRSPTNSLRIDHFLRPFTLKAVQELLGKTGTVTSFWMDHIKTHCYVTYSSEQEAINTRNAVYNLQWPPNGGRLLVAEFVEPEEVKMRAEAPPQLPAAPVNVGPSGPTPPTSVPQPSPRQATLRQQQLPTPTLPPPPPLPNPPPTRERVLPPQPPLPEKVDPPIVTLDDLFKKTKATPRIYYLPLSEEQISAKLQARSRNTKQ